MNMIKLPDKPKEIIDTFHKNKFECYAVGGCVRNLIMQRTTGDWDFTTNANPDQIQKLFPENSFYENTYGTVGVKLEIDGQEHVFEITTYRKEQGYSDRRHPDHIEWGTTIEEDLSRRDFTINAIAYDGKQMIDPFHGNDDIEAKLIRAVGDASTRFKEDALRLMRAVRIATQLGFTIEINTLHAIRQHAASIQTVAHERIRDELLKILASPHPADGILLLKDTNLLFEILPEFEKAFQTEQKSPKRHHIFDVGTHLIESLRHCPSPDPIVRFATLLHDIGKPDTKKITDEGVTTFYNHEINGTTMVRDIAMRLRFSKKDTGRIIRLVRWHQFSVDEHQTDSALRRIIRNIGRENVEDMLALRTGDRLGGGVPATSWRLELFKKRLDEVQQQPFSIQDLKIDGRDVMDRLGIPPGPEVGTVLKKIFDEVDRGTVNNDRDQLLELITKK